MSIARERPPHWARAPPVLLPSEEAALSQQPEGGLLTGHEPILCSCPLRRQRYVNSQRAASSLGTSPSCARAQ